MKSRGFWLSALICSALFPQAAQADVAGRYENTNENAPFDFEMSIEADDLDNVRIQMATGNQYYLYREGIMYVVTVGSEETTVMKLEDMLTVQMEAMARLGWEDPFESAPVSASHFAPMDEVVVGSRNGRGYGIVSEERELPVYASIVISDDPELKKLGRAIARANASSVRGMGSMATMLQTMSSEMLALLEQGAPLRMLSVELTDVSFDEIPPERFSLPTEPLTIEEVRNLLIGPTIAPPPTLPSRSD